MQQSIQHMKISVAYWDCSFFSEVVGRGVGGIWGACEKMAFSDIFYAIP